MGVVNVAFACDCALVVVCLYVALFTARLAGAPGWSAYRWFAAVAATAGLYIAAEGLTSFDWGDPVSRAWKSRIGLCWALLHAGLWLEYARRELRLPSSRVDRMARWALAVGVAVTLLTPHVYRPVLDAPIQVRWLNATYIHNTGGPLAGPVFVLALVVTAVAAFRFWRAGREGNPDAGRTGAALFLLITLGLCDSAAALGLWKAPLLLGVGFLASVATHELGQARRLVGLAIGLEELSARLGREVDERSRALLEALAAVQKNERLATVGRLVKGVAHEINNPAAAIKANLEYLLPSMQAGKLDGDAVECVQESVDAIDRIGRIVSQLRDATHAAGEGLELITVDVRAAAKTAIVDTTRRFSGLRVRVEVPERLQIRGAPTYLVQILANLLMNAAQASSPGAEIVIRAHEQGERVVIEVADPGMGMSAETQAQLFVPFFTTKPFGKAIGLGLAVCRGLVQIMNGSIEVSSSPGRGTTMRLLLDRAPSQRQADNHLALMH